MTYLDNAATSWPKPDSVYQSSDEALRHGGSPGRGGHRLSLNAGRYIEDTRRLLAKLFSAPAPESIIFTSNATDALNLAIKGAVSHGDHIITSSLEHNSVMRPLEVLKAKDITNTVVHTSPLYGVDIDDVRKAIQHNTKLMVFTHISNVTGTVNPIEQLGALCREHGILLLIDAAQSAGAFPIDVTAMAIDLLAFPGHKSLLGPQGTGGLYIKKGIQLATLREGGTGSFSELPVQPERLPDKYESGTLNTPGLAGLGAGVSYLLEEGLDAVRAKESRLANRLLEGLHALPGVTVYGPGAGQNRSGVVSISIDGIYPGDIALILDNTFDIFVRAGLHCAPAAHRTIGTVDRGGTVRFSVGQFSTENDIDHCLGALQAITEDCHF